MGKKYHAVCVGRKPGLYTEWAGPDGAEVQKNCISGYNQQTGMLSTNDPKAAIDFLRSNPIRSVQFNFNVGTNMTFDELLQKDDRLAKLLQTNAPSAANTEIKTEYKDAVAVAKPDTSRILKASVSQRVNDYCNQHDKFEKLSEDQRRAVQAIDGKYLLFAVPGSGKTTVMIARAGFMVHVCGIPASRLMNMTFTRAAAKEMREKYRSCFPTDDEGSIPDFRTIHSFCMCIVIPRLRRAGFICPHHVVDEDLNDKTKEKKEYVQRAIIAQILKKHGVRKASDESTQDIALTAFSCVKNHRMNKKEYSQYKLRIEKQEFPVAVLFEEYQQKLLELDCMDYDDMLIYSLNGLQMYPYVLRKLQSIYGYWSIDEAQDNSRVQNDLLDLLCGPKGNLFMVGDDDQSIYSFRGAVPSMFLSFGNRHDVFPLMMGINYRSYADIVASSKAFIENNNNRADKQMVANHKEHGTISIPQNFPNEAELYAYIVRTARHCQAHNKKLGVLYPLNASALPLIVHMHRSGIPFESSRGLTELLRVGVVGRLFRVLRFADDPVNLKKFHACRKDLRLYSENEEQKERLEKLHKAQPQAAILRLILDSMQSDDINRIHIQRIYDVLTKAHGMRPSDALTSILQKLSGIADHETLCERMYIYGVLSVCDMYDTLHDMLVDLENMKKQEKQTLKDEDDEFQDREASHCVTTGESAVAVSLSTIHSAKGREWDYVMLIDVFDEVLPGKPQFDRIGYDPEEARRVFYVAATRAIERLDILGVEAYHGNSEPASSFIAQFAYEADQIAEHSVEDRFIPQSVEAGVICQLEPNKYYSVPIGPKPGVYTQWSEVEALKKGLSIPPEMQPKGHGSFEEAWNRVFPGRPLPQADKNMLADKSIRQYMQLSGGAVFNFAMDLPHEIYRGMFTHLNAASLNSLTAVQLDRIVEQSRFEWNTARTDYHGRADGYTLAYLPVNFYKIWLPLWKLLEKGVLPINPAILEIGPGPGTSTWSIIEFYKRLAADNPSKRFALKYRAVEKEPDFQALFHRLRNAVLTGLPSNLCVQIEMQAGRDAFEYMNTLTGNDIDLVVESNVLNAQEDFTGRTVRAYLRGLRNCLSNKGYAVLLEPREKQRPSQFAKFIGYATKGQEFAVFTPVSDAAVNVAGIGLFHDSLAANIRYNRSTEHWFSYAILTTKESV